MEVGERVERVDLYRGPYDEKTVVETGESVRRVGEILSQRGRHSTSIVWVDVIIYFIFNVVYTPA